ncbi:hypothetical protein TeGR_g13791, partial [Tetraparma gracilis]
FETGETIHEDDVIDPKTGKLVDDIQICTERDMALSHKQFPRSEWAKEPPFDKCMFVQCGDWRCKKWRKVLRSEVASKFKDGGGWRCGKAGIRTVEVPGVEFECAMPDSTVVERKVALHPRPISVKFEKIGRFPAETVRFADSWEAAKVILVRRGKLRAGVQDEEETEKRYAEETVAIAGLSGKINDMHDTGGGVAEGCQMTYMSVTERMREVERELDGFAIDQREAGEAEAEEAEEGGGGDKRKPEREAAGGEKPKKQHKKKQAAVQLSDADEQERKAEQERKDAKLARELDRAASRGPTKRARTQNAPFNIAKGELGAYACVTKKQEPKAAAQQDEADEQADADETDEQEQARKAEQAREDEKLAWELARASERGPKRARTQNEPFNIGKGELGAYACAKKQSPKKESAFEWDNTMGGDLKINQQAVHERALELEESAKDSAEENVKLREQVKKLERQLAKTEKALAESEELEEEEEEEDSDDDKRLSFFAAHDDAAAAVDAEEADDEEADDEMADCDAEGGNPEEEGRVGEEAGSGEVGVGAVHKTIFENVFSSSSDDDGDDDGDDAASVDTYI